MSDKAELIIKEAKRLEENCLYTSTTLYIWLRRVRLTNALMVGAPAVLGGVAGVSALQLSVPAWITAVCALLAGVLPALGYALKLETRIDEIARLASEYKALQTRFRQLAENVAITDLPRAEILLDVLTGRYEAAVSASVTPPEWAFLEARHKIRGGHYDFEADIGNVSAT